MYLTIQDIEAIIIRQSQFQEDNRDNQITGLSSLYQPQGIWMITNKHTGPIGTDPLKGCFNQEIFRYMIYVIGNADDPLLKVECSTQMTSMSGMKESDQKGNTFEPTAEGLTSLNEWLDEQYQEYLEKMQ